MKKLLLVIVAFISTLNSYSQIDVNPQNGCVPLTSNFSSATVAGATLYEWWYNGVQVATGQNANYTFTVSGNGLIELRAYDSGMNQIQYDYS